MQRRFKCKISKFEAFFLKGENLWVLGLSEGFLHIESKNIIHKREKTGFYKNSMFSQMKDSVKNEKQLRVWRNYLQVTHLTKVLECIKDYQKSIKIGTIQLENSEKI